MEKNKLNRFINKYSLSGKVNSVVWKIKDDILQTSFCNENRTMLGKVELDKFSFEDVKLGIYDTEQLQKMLNALSDNITFSVKKFAEKPLSVVVESDNTLAEFVVSDTSVIPESPKMKKIPEFQTALKIDTVFINSFIKGKTALPDINLFTIVKNDNGCGVVIGYSSMATNRINISVENTRCGLEKNLHFNADLFKEILQSNRECTNAVLEVSNEGLAKIKFNIDDFKSEYYLTEEQGVD